MIPKYIVRATSGL